MNADSSEENNSKYLQEIEIGIALHNGIHINPVLLRALDYNYAQAIMLSQYIYVSAGKNGKEFLYQDENFMYSIGNQDRITRAKKSLKEKCLISVVRKGIPACSYITVNHEAVNKLIKENVIDTYLSIPEYMRNTQDCENRNIKIRENQNQDSAICGNWIPRFAESNNKDINKDIIKENTKRNPASGSPSSPDVDELSENVSSIKHKKVKKLKDYEKDELFLSTWKTLPEYMRGCGPVKAYKMWVKATEKSTKNVEEIKKAITFYLKTLPEWQHPQHFSTFLNQGTWEEFCARAIEREHRQEQQPTQTENQKYWEDHENTQVIASKKVEQPKNLQLNIIIARKLGLLDKFLPDEYNNEWKFLPKEIKEVLTSEAVEKAVKQIKDKEETLINQIACVTMLGREGYCNWHDKCEEETGERPLEDIEWYIPFGKKLPSGFWTWLVKYSHNFGLPSNSQVERVRKWFYTTPRSPFHFLFEQR